MAKIELDRPLVVFDLETTGTDTATDRIVEISVLRLDPGGQREQRTRRINPGRPIPAEATAVHGIRDEDVRDAPTFASVARGLLEFIGEADLSGFNVARFDVPLLERELRDCGLDLRLAERRIVDAMTIFHRKEPRDLSAAARFYLDRDHAGAHAAEADVTLTLDILEAQLERYEDLPRSVGELDGWCRPVVANAVDREGKFVWKDGEATFAFGKHQGQSLRRVAGEHRGYLEWISKSDFPDDVKQLAAQALDGRYPQAQST